MISIKQAKRIRESINCTHLVIFAVDENGVQHVATHGRSENDAREAAKAGNNLKAALGWDKSLCTSEPVERICKNCEYFKPDYGTHCMNGWSKDGTDGHCQYERENIPVAGDNKCSCFLPK